MFDENFVHAMALLGAGIAVVCGFGQGIGQGIAAGKGAMAASENPEAINQIRSVMVLGIALAETCAIFALVVAVILVFVKG